jgi:hypothetical protein
MFAAHRPHQKLGGTTVMGAVRQLRCHAQDGTREGGWPSAGEKSVHKGTFRLFTNFSLTSL